MFPRGVGPRLPTGAEAQGDPSAGGSAAQSQPAGPPDGLGRPPQPVLQKQQQQGADRPLRRHCRSRGPAESHRFGGDAETADRCMLALEHQQAVEMCRTGGVGVEVATGGGSSNCNAFKYILFSVI